MPWLPPIKTSPNCVSSLADPADATHYIAPLPFTDEPAAARLRLLAALAAIGAKVTHDDGTTIFAEHQTRVFKWVDDLHFYIDSEKKRIEWQSISRVGHWDLGTNRRRLEGLRALLQTGAGR